MMACQLCGGDTPNYQREVDQRNEITQLRQRIKELEAESAKWQALAEANEKLASSIEKRVRRELESGQGEPVAWLYEHKAGDGEEILSDVKWKGSQRAYYEETPLYESAPHIPDGWVLVPKEPTEKMLRAGQSFQGEHVYASHEVANIYRDMLEAAHKPGHKL